jgi:hypothetical protein
VAGEALHPLHRADCGGPSKAGPDPSPGAASRGAGAGVALVRAAARGGSARARRSGSFMIS